MHHIDSIKSRIKSKEDIAKQVNVWRLLSKKIVFTNGCFDILHHGHVDYLANAADLGDVLIVGVNSDDSVKRLGKADSRPIQNENDRALILAALRFIDAIVIFNEDTPMELIKLVEPDVLVKGGDWEIDKIVGSDLVRQRGGLVTTIDFVPGYSTTAIEKRIKES